mgnify:CR=1 FL=1
MSTAETKVSTKKYITTIGLEIHAELKTQTKMFCACKNDTDEKKPNANVCPICMGHPGTLPVINGGAVKQVLKLGLTVGGKLADFTEFDRKNYFYPDIPKGYQISQYKYPLVEGGELAGVKLTRVHLEEDTAKSTHDTGDHSLVHFNRAGLPLMELVTEPVIHDAETASRFAKELQLLLRTLGAGEANMEKGEMRVEANISVAPEGQKKFGTKVEVKNLNSFRAVEKAIAYEVARHIQALEKGAALVQETRGWDENKQSTFAQRAKEHSHDYRYFPDPDLPKLYLSELQNLSIEALKGELPELPWARRERYEKDFGIKSQDAEILVNTPSLGTYFEAVVSELVKLENGPSGGAEKSAGKAEAKLVKLAANYLLTDYLGLLKADSKSSEAEKTENLNLAKIKASRFAEMIGMIGKNLLSSRAAKDILAIMHKTDGSPAEIAEREGMLQQNDEAGLKQIMAEIIASNAKVVADFKAGKTVALQSLIGQGMKVTKGSANPEILKKITLELLA